MKKLITLVAALIACGHLQAQIPTIDISSLQQLYSQYQTMQQQLNTAKSIYSTANNMLSEEKNIYNNALGDISKITGSVNSWVNSFSDLRNIWEQRGNWFQNSALAPLQGFDNNVNYWVRQIGGGYQGITDLQTCWQTSVSKVNTGTATDWEKNLAQSGYNSRLVDNAKTSRAYGSNIVNLSQTVVDNTKSGTLIEQAAAQNTLLYQQTALLDKMKNDINDSTVAEAAERDAKLKAKKDESDKMDAMDSMGPP
jgi:hypothetical protein